MSFPQKILVAPLRFIGDGILTVPLLRALHRHYPEAQIDLLVPKHMANLLESCPYLNEIHILPSDKKLLLPKIKAQQYDTAILMRRSLSDAFLLKRAGVKNVIGYDEQRFPPPLSYRRWGWFLDAAVPFPPLTTTIPQVKTYLQLLEPLGCTDAEEYLELWADQADEQLIARLFKEYGVQSNTPIAVIHGTSASREKALSVEKFVPAVKTLGKAGLTLITLGGENDGPYYQALFEKAEVPFINLCGQTTLRQSYDLMKRITLLLSLDSAPIHMATAAGVPHIVGIYGATNEKQWCPYPYKGQFTPVYNTELTCRPCVPKVCSHNRCRTDLSPLAIQQAIESHLESILLKNPLCR
jgi:heptosyltransferase III